MYKIFHMRFRSGCTIHVDNPRTTGNTDFTEAGAMAPVTDRVLYSTQVKDKNLVLSFFSKEN